MYCPNCGANCEEGHRFCAHCGTALPQPDAVAAEENSQTSALEEPEESCAPVEECLPAEPIAEDCQAAAMQASEEAPRCAEECLSSVPAETSAAPQEKRKGRLWPPVLLLALMTALGLLVFFLSRGSIGMDPAMPWFQVKNGTLYFNEALYTGNSELTVPETIGGQTVTALSEGCFAQCSRLTTVILPDTLTEIGPMAFSRCISMRGILIPESVKSIGANAFEGCSSLEAICISGTISSIGDHAFLSCSKLHHVFFIGTYPQWAYLYSEAIAGDTLIYCIDGVYRHLGGA